LLTGVAMTTGTVKSVAKRDGCGDWLVLHLIFLYGFVGSLFVAIVFVHINGRQQYARIIDELDRLRTRSEDTVDLGPWLLPNRPSEDGSSVGILQRLSDGVETVAAEQRKERRRRRDVMSVSSSPVDTTLSPTAPPCRLRHHPVAYGCGRR